MRPPAALLDWRKPDLGVYELPKAYHRVGHVRVNSVEGDGSDRALYLEWDAQSFPSGIWVYDCTPCRWDQWELLWTKQWKP